LLAHLLEKLRSLGILGVLPGTRLLGLSGLRWGRSSRWSGGHLGHRHCDIEPE
jgi:hypothetical protein